MLVLTSPVGAPMAASTTLGDMPAQDTPVLTFSAVIGGASAHGVHAIINTRTPSSNTHEHIWASRQPAGLMSTTLIMIMLALLRLQCIPGMQSCICLRNRARNAPLPRST